MKSILKLFLCLTALLLCMSAVAMAETCTGAHEMKYEINYNQHCGTCVNCDYTTGWSGHFTSCSRDTSKCFGCGSSATEVQVVIVHSDEGMEWKSEGKMHYQVCSGCGEKFNEGTHHAVCSAPNVCVECGATSNIDWVEHSIDWNNPQKDADSHWYICDDCGEKANESNHYGNCLSPNTCLECGAAFSGGDWVNHHYDWDKPEMNDTHHWWMCEDCGEKADMNEHQVVCNGTTCIDCGYAGTITNKFHSWMYLEEGHDATHHWSYCTKCEEYEYYWEHYPDENGNCWCGQTGLYDCQHANVVTVSTIDATCSKGGFAVKICKDCGENLETFNTDPLSHKYETTTTSATCTAEGETKVACVYCGEVKSTEKLPKLAHEGWWNLAAEPTCLTAGVKAWSCRYCDVPMGDEAIPALGHKQTDAEDVTILVDVVDVENTVKALSVKIVAAEGVTSPEAVTATLPVTEDEAAALTGTKLVQLLEDGTKVDLTYEIAEGKLTFTAAAGTVAFVAE